MVYQVGLTVINQTIGKELDNAQEFMQAFALAVGGNTNAQTALKDASGGTVEVTDSGNTTTTTINVRYSGALAGLDKSMTAMDFEMDSLGMIMQANNMQELIKQLISTLSQSGKGLNDPMKEAIESWKRS